jgi:hypothetical protein
MRPFCSLPFLFACLPYPERDPVSAAIELDALGVQRVQLQSAPGATGCAWSLLARLAPGKSWAFVAHFQANPLSADVKTQIDGLIGGVPITVNHGVR